MKVKLIGCTQLQYDVEGENVLIDMLYGQSDDELMVNNSEQDAIIEYAARVCYNSTDKMFHNPTFIQARLEHKHGDIAEHVNYVFMIEDISVACLGQMVRHGLMSHSVSSTRYVDQFANSAIVPSTISDHVNNELYELYLQHIGNSYELYGKLRQAGIPKEDARYVLPVANSTKLIVSGNALMWRNFIAQRSHQAAQWEIRAVSNAVLETLYYISPKTFSDLYNQFISK